MKKKIPMDIYDRILIEAKHQCSICNEKKAVVHHIIPVSQGGKNNYDNLIALCLNCHDRAHRDNISPSQLRKYKKIWVNYNNSQLTNEETINRLINLTDPNISLMQKNELINFDKRVKYLKKSLEIYNVNCIISNHIIHKKILSNGSAKTEERMIINPLESMSYRQFYLRGDSPINGDNLNFQGTIIHKKDKYTPKIELINNEKEFKVFRFYFKQEITNEDIVEIKFSFEWPENTWDLNEDQYSYDVLSILERITLNLILPKKFEIKYGRISRINIFGNPSHSDYKLEIYRNRLIWQAKKLPLFNTYLISYKT